MAKMRFAAYLEVDLDVLIPENQDAFDELYKHFSRLKGVGINVTNIEADSSRSFMKTVDLPIYITVVDGKVTEIWYDSHYDNQDYPLDESDFSVEYKSSQ